MVASNVAYFGSNSNDPNTDPNQRSATGASRWTSKFIDIAHACASEWSIRTGVAKWLYYSFKDGHFHICDAEKHVPNVHQIPDHTLTEVQFGYYKQPLWEWTGTSLVKKTIITDGKTGYLTRKYGRKFKVPVVPDRIIQQVECDGRPLARYKDGMCEDIPVETPVTQPRINLDDIHYRLGAEASKWMQKEARKTSDIDRGVHHAIVFDNRITDEERARWRRRPISLGEQRQYERERTQTLPDDRRAASWAVRPALTPKELQQIELDQKALTDSQEHDDKCARARQTLALLSAKAKATKRNDALRKARWSYYFEMQEEFKRQGLLPVERTQGFLEEWAAKGFHFFNTLREARKFASTAATPKQAMTVIRTKQGDYTVTPNGWAADPQQIVEKHYYPFGTDSETADGHRRAPSVQTMPYRLGDRQLVWNIYGKIDLEEEIVQQIDHNKAHRAGKMGKYYTQPTKRRLKIPLLLYKALEEDERNEIHYLPPAIKGGKVSQAWVSLYTFKGQPIRMNTEADALAFAKELGLLEASAAIDSTAFERFESKDDDPGIYGDEFENREDDRGNEQDRIEYRAMQ